MTTEVRVTDTETAVIYIPLVKMWIEQPSYRAIVKHVYEASGIETELVGSGETDEKAAENLAHEITDWVKHVLNSAAFLPEEEQNIILNSGDEDELIRGADGMATVLLFEEEERTSWSCEVSIEFYDHAARPN